MNGFFGTPEEQERLRQQMQAGVQPVSPQINAPRLPQQPQQQAAPQGLLDRLMSGAKDFTSDPSRMAKMAMAFNSMRITPDQGLAAALNDRIKTNEALKLQNKTVLAYEGALKKMGVPDDQIASAQGDITVLKGMYDTLLAQSKQQAPSAVREYEMAKQLYGYNGTYEEFKRLGGGGTTIDMKGETKFQEELGKGAGQMVVSDYENAVPMSEVLGTVSLLRELSPAVGQSAIPQGLRSNPYISKFSTPVSAYNSILNGLVQSLRVAGSGSQSDRDVELILQRGGSPDASVEAREVAHSALENMASRKAQIAQAASQVMAGQMTQQEYFQRRNEILAQPLLTEQQRAALEGIPSSGAGMKTSNPFLDQLTKNLNMQQPN